jgi:hypothetical protein
MQWQALSTPQKMALKGGRASAMPLFKSVLAALNACRAFACWQRRGNEPAVATRHNNHKRRGKRRCHTAAATHSQRCLDHVHVQVVEQLRDAGGKHVVGGQRLLRSSL